MVNKLFMNLKSSNLIGQLQLGMVEDIMCTVLYIGALSWQLLIILVICCILACALLFGGFNIDNFDFQLPK